MICAACNTELLPGDAYLECTVDTCMKVYHYLCNNRELALDERAAWVCPECCCAVKRGGCNDDIPIPALTPISQKFVSVRNKSNTPAPQSSQQLPNNMGMEMQLLREQINFLSEQLMEALATIGKYQSALTVCTKQIEICNEKLETFEKLNDASHGICGHVAAPCMQCMQPMQSTQSEAFGDEIKITEVQTIKIKPKQKTKSKPQQAPSKPREVSEVSAAKPVIIRADNNNEKQVFVPPVVVTPASSKENIVGAVLGQKGVAPLSQTFNTNSADEGWTEVRKNKPKRISAIRGTAGPDVTMLKAVAFRKYIHLWNMISCGDDIQAYLQKLFPDVTCTVEELKSRGDYKSFKVGIPPECYERCMSPETWPTNARVKDWFFRRQPNTRQTATTN